MTAHVRFEHERDGCCCVCNPARLADYEQHTVRAVSPIRQARQVELCTTCIIAFVMAQNGNERVRVSLEPEVLETADLCRYINAYETAACNAAGACTCDLCRRVKERSKS